MALHSLVAPSQLLPHLDQEKDVLLLRDAPDIEGVDAAARDAVAAEMVRRSVAGVEGLEVRTRLEKGDRLRRDEDLPRHDSGILLRAGEDVEEPFVEAGHKAVGGALEKGQAGVEADIGGDVGMVGAHHAVAVLQRQFPRRQTERARRGDVDDVRVQFEQLRFEPLPGNEGEVELPVEGHREAEERSDVVDIGGLGDRFDRGGDDMEVEVEVRRLPPHVLDEARDTVQVSEGVGEDTDFHGNSRKL